MPGTVLAIDQGTTSTRSIVFSDAFQILGLAQEEFPQHYPRSGWVEHDPEDLWRTTVETARGALAAAGVDASQIAAIGITNQRETTLVWEKATGRPIHNAIVWQDRRTTAICERLTADGLEPIVTDRTGLIVDPYFSGTKIAWLLDAVEGARAMAERGELAFGTVDSWLLWRLTGGEIHATDATNAARTMLYDIARGAWDEELCEALGVPVAMLPEVFDSDHLFGHTVPDLFGRPIAIAGVAGDQQAATIGQAAFAPGMVKSTYGTGCFALLNTGNERVRSTNRLLTTIAYRLGGEVTYALEGSIFVAGAAVQWLRDGLGLLRTSAESGELAAKADPELPVYLVPAFVGLGAPHWDPDARGALFGLSRGVGTAEVALAALESVCFQTLDLVEAMRGDWAGGAPLEVIRVDGGMTASDFTMQRLADILAVPVDRPRVMETTALGAAWLAGHRVGAWAGMQAFSEAWQLERRFEPRLPEAERTRRIAGWRDAVRRTRSTLA
jgi:glycerol kinase